MLLSISLHCLYISVCVIGAYMLVHFILSTVIGTMYCGNSTSFFISSSGGNGTSPQAKIESVKTKIKYFISLLYHKTNKITRGVL
jgi:hypothetical protein